MGIIVMLMALATLTPFLLVQLNKKILAGIQAVMLVGMWFYFFGTMFHTVEAFSILGVMFYASMILAAVAWIMFAGLLIREYEGAKGVTE